MIDISKEGDTYYLVPVPSHGSADVTTLSQANKEKFNSFQALPLKINVVLLKGINEDEIGDFASFTLENNVDVTEVSP